MSASPLVPFTSRQIRLSLAGALMSSSPLPLQTTTGPRPPDFTANGPVALDQFDLGVTLGTGSFGRVRFCTHKVRKLFNHPTEKGRSITIEPLHALGVVIVMVVVAV